MKTLVKKQRIFKVKDLDNLDNLEKTDYTSTTDLLSESCYKDISSNYDYDLDCTLITLTDYDNMELHYVVFSQVSVEIA